MKCLNTKFVHNADHPRRGHSMMEMVVVMSVLAGMAAISWPMLKSPMNKMRLQAAAQEVSSAMAKARLKAMQSGEAQLFRIQLHTGKFQVLPLSEDDASDMEQFESAAQTGMELVQGGAVEHSPLNEQSDRLSEEKELPEGICFEVPMDEEFTDSGDSVASDDDEEWTDFAVFYPDGATTTAVVGLHGEPDLHLDVKLSGLTGIAKIGETRRQELR